MLLFIAGNIYCLPTNSLPERGSFETIPSEFKKLAFPGNVLIIRI